MKNDTVIDIKKPEAFINDPISEVIRHGARRLLTAALEAEVESFLNQYKQMQDKNGHKRVVRNGYLPEREIQTGIGQVSVKAPRVHDRYPDPQIGRIRFPSSILPPYLRRTRSIETVTALAVFKRHFYR